MGLGEVILIINLSFISTYSLFIILFLSFFSAAYRLILYSSTNQGQIITSNISLNYINTREIHVLFSHVWLERPTRILQEWTGTSELTLPLILPTSMSEVCLAEGLIPWYSWIRGSKTGAKSL